MIAPDGLSLTFSALADPTRRDILGRLRGGPATVSDLAAKYDMTRPAVSQHLRVLENAGLIVRAQRAKWHDCTLDEQGLDAAVEWIEHQRAEWAERFDLLEKHLHSRRGVPAGGADDSRPTSETETKE